MRIETLIHFSDFVFVIAAIAKILLGLGLLTPIICVAADHSPRF